jgi:hypothetical protein
MGGVPRERLCLGEVGEGRWVIAGQKLSSEARGLHILLSLG